jgi:hypothetical protein
LTPELPIDTPGIRATFSELTLPAMGAIIVSTRSGPVSVSSLWALRGLVQAEVGSGYQVGIHLRSGESRADLTPPFVDIVVEELVGELTVVALVGALKTAAKRWRASGVIPSWKAGRVRVWICDDNGQLQLQWEEETEARE